MGDKSLCRAWKVAWRTGCDGDAYMVVSAIMQKMAVPHKILYLTNRGTTPSVMGKLAGIKRYCASRGWEAQRITRAEFSPENLPQLLKRLRPAGCVVDGVGNQADLPPRLFGEIPVSYIGYMRGRTGNRPNFHFDTKAIAEAAYRELASGKPPCYAAVGHPFGKRWPLQRIRAFCNIVRAAGGECHVFKGASAHGDISWDEFGTRLAEWLGKLPEHCAIFAVSDEAAVRVAAAASKALRPIPRNFTLVSVDNFPELCENGGTAISSIQLDFERAGFLAAKVLDGQSQSGVRNMPPRKKRNAGFSSRQVAQSAQSAPSVPAAPPILVPPLLVVRRKSTGGYGRKEKFVLDAVDMIRREACEGLTAAALIARFPGTRRLFDMRFREAIGHSVLDEIIHVRLEKACTLLARTNTPIGSIPELCGFSCNRTLDALFRTRFGMGMRNWRKHNS